MTIKEIPGNQNQLLSILKEYSEQTDKHLWIAHRMGGPIIFAFSQWENWAWQNADESTQQEIVRIRNPEDISNPDSPNIKLYRAMNTQLFQMRSFQDGDSEDEMSINIDDVSLTNFQTTFERLKNIYPPLFQVEIPYPELKPNIFMIREAYRVWKSILSPREWLTLGHDTNTNIPFAFSFFDRSKLMPRFINVVGLTILEKFFDRFYLPNEIVREPKYTKEFWNFMADRYDDIVKTEFADEKEAILKKLFSLLPHKKGMFLDLGSGSGGAMPYRKGGGWVGVDISEEMCQKARQTGYYSRVYEGDVSNMPFFNKDSFDGAIMALTSQWINDFLLLLSEASRVIKPGGWLVFNLRRVQDGWQEEYGQLMVMAGFRKIKFRELKFTREYGEIYHAGIIAGQVAR